MKCACTYTSHAMVVLTEGKIIFSSDIWSDSQSSTGDVRKGKLIVGRMTCRILEQTTRDWGGLL